MKKKIVLASTSRYRAELLGRLRIPFSIASPGVEETAHAAERPEDLAQRLSVAKAQAVAQKYPSTPVLVIGSDQVACVGATILGKPLTPENARLQLRAMRGRDVHFWSGVAVVDCETKRVVADVVLTKVTMREYSDREIEAYLTAENALDCAGSAKSEGLGVALIASMQSDDPTALVGLPLIRLVTMLSDFGVNTLDHAEALP